MLTNYHEIFVFISKIGYIIVFYGDKLKMSILSFFYEHPVFRMDEFLQWKTLQGTSNPVASHSALKYYVKKGRLIRIRRNLYAVVPPNSLPDELLVDPYLVAAKVAKDSILAYHTALELHGTAHSTFGQFTFFTTQKIKPFIFQQQAFQPIIASTILQKQKQNDFAVETINRQGLMIRITNLARTFVDVLSHVELCGGWEEVVRSLNTIAVLDIKTVIDYTLTLNNKTLMAKVGYFLEQRKGAFAVNEKILEPLLKLKPQSPQYLADHQREKCQFIKRWNLMVPVSIIKQSWEEPNHDV